MNSKDEIIECLKDANKILLESEENLNDEVEELRSRLMTKEGRNPRREEVYCLIDGERDYQKKWDNEAIENNLPNRCIDKNNPVESWLVWMQRYMRLAEDEASMSHDKTRVLANVRKIAALAVACMEYHEDTPAR